MEKRYISLVLVFGGFFLIVVGLNILFDKPFSFFGKLPGDIRIEREHFSFYFPLTSMLIISLILTILLNIISKILK